ncbi:hypothetical protein DH2020_049677 [Rehmannia glutinosa]|uniref:Response regulatory domain-containing protein n=1 Tax=Rehmannia glutinosa TaxID=99300 RepID=A0ABR0U246_REHGL
MQLFHFFYCTRSRAVENLCLLRSFSTANFVSFSVTTCNLAIEALNLLRERKDGYDIVISDVNMPDMDGFKLLEHVGLEMDLPVIMMSVDGETSRVMKGVQHGACDYLLKPIRMKELRNIWQHVFRKRIHEVRDIEGHECLDEIQMMRCGGEQSDDGYLFSGDMISGKKRKDVDNKHDDRMCGDPSSAKKARVVWTVDLHQKFVKAVNQIGFESKFIISKFKYRLYLTRLQKENELKAAFGATKHSDISPKDICPQNSITQNTTTVQQHNILANESYAVSRHKILTQNDKPKIGILSMSSMTEPKKALFGDTTDLAKTGSSSISFDHSFGPSDSKSESKIKPQFSWNAEVPSLQFKQEHKPHFQTEHKFVPMHHHVHVDPVHPGTSSRESDNRTQCSIGKVTKDENTPPALFTLQPESHLIDPLRLWDEGFNDYPSSQGEFHPPPDAYLGNIVESYGYNNHELVADVAPHLYDSLRFDTEYLSDPVEYPVIDQGLFIA